jgi:hypothetical protein
VQGWRVDERGQGSKVEVEDERVPGRRQDREAFSYRAAP